MKLTELQYELVKDVMPRQRGNVRQSNLDVLNAVLYVAESGCKWRDLPKEFGNWNTIYVRLNRWAKSGVLDRVFEALQRERVLRMKIEVTSLESTSIQKRSDKVGESKKSVCAHSVKPEEEMEPKFIWSPRMGCF